MYKVKEAIVVEGTYDRIKLSGFVDAVIIQTNGFTVFKDKNKLKTRGRTTGKCYIKFCKLLLYLRTAFSFAYSWAVIGFTVFSNPFL